MTLAVRRLFRSRRHVGPEISVVVVVHDMEREAERTLYTLSGAYQRSPGVEYEVIVVDNGSEVPLGEAFVRSFGKGFRYHYVDNATASPAPAVNLGARLARGRVLGIMIDGARMLTPGVLFWACAAFRAFENPVVATPSWHLGHEPQTISVPMGYDQQEEDRLLDSVDWKRDGYRLFDIASFAGSSKGGLFAPLGESNCLFLRKDVFKALGGFDERFDLAGGGLVNLDFYKRACECEARPLVVLMGEGTFHQVHGGIATNAGADRLRSRTARWMEQYETIRGGPLSRVETKAVYLGHVPTPYVRFLSQSVKALSSQEPNE